MGNVSSACFVSLSTINQHVVGLLQHQLDETNAAVCIPRQRAPLLPLTSNANGLFINNVSAFAFQVTSCFLCLSLRMHGANPVCCQQYLDSCTFWLFDWAVLHAGDQCTRSFE